jgi:uncharacterized protein
LNIPTEFGIITIAIEMAVDGGPAAHVSYQQIHAHKPLFGKIDKVMNISICNMWSINNAGRPGLNRLYTKYYRLTTNRPSTTVENPLQIHPFLCKTNPIFKKSNERNRFINNELWGNGHLVNWEKRTQNEPKTNPNEPNLNPILAQKIPKQTQFKPKQIQFHYPERRRKAVLFNGVYKPANDRYYIRRKCRCSSMVEHSFRKAGVEGSNPSIGFMNLQQKYNSLQQVLKGLGKLVVAYSGGVDSTFLLKAAVDTLGAENVLACISTGVAEPSNQLKRAADYAKNIGAELQVIETGELDDPEFTANKADRCFHCKSHICKVLLDIAKERGFDHVAFGTNYDDDFRPGNRAMKVFGIRSPLAEAELTKEDIRQLSRQMNLPTADLPSSPCLASRIAYGIEVTEQRLKQIDEAEEFLRQLGLVEFRVRHHDTVARIEVNPQDIDMVTKEPNRSKIIEKLKSLGFKFVTVDLQGFRSGSLNEPLSEEEKRKSLN